MREPLSEPTESTAPTPPADAAKIARLHHKARRLRRLNQLRWASTKIALTICLIRAARVAFGIAFHLPLWTIVLAVLCITPAIFDKKLKADWRKTIHALTEVGDAQAVGPLIEGLEITEERGFAREMLAVVLPRLKANDAPLLTPRHHRILNRQLSSKSVSIGIWRRAFTLATLNAYEQVGGTGRFANCATIGERRRLRETKQGHSESGAGMSSLLAGPFGTAGCAANAASRLSFRRRQHRHVIASGSRFRRTGPAPTPAFCGTEGITRP